MLVDKEYEYLNCIPNSNKYISAELVGGGWSSDLKFKLVDKENKPFLLRVSNISQKEKKQSEFNVLISLKDLGISYSNPLEFGVLEEYAKVYMLLSWMTGDNVEVMMPKLSEKEQYECGVKAGVMLRKMHTIPASVSCEDWKNKNLKKLKERLELYEKCDGYVIEHIDEMVKFIDDNVDLLDNRPMRFLHGDYQGRNIVVDNDCNVGVIDFERTAFGDPFEEFNRMMTYTRRWSIDFCRGQVDGYFLNESIPDNFWKIVAFHCALNLITTIVYGVYTQQKHIYEENEIAKNVIYDDFEGFTKFAPKWYINR